MPLERPSVYNMYLFNIQIANQILIKAMIVDDVNIIRELIDVHENKKCIYVVTMCDVDFMIASIFIN